MEFDNTETYWSRAKSDTMSVLGGGAPLVVTIGAIPVVGFALKGFLRGGQTVMGDILDWIILGLAATGLVAIGLLIFNLVLAPHRQRNEARIAVNDRGREISLLRSSRPELKVDIRGSISGGILPDGSIAFCLPNITLSNIGDKPTTFELERLEFFSGDAPIKSEIIHVSATFENGLDGKAVKFEAERALYAVSDEPIAPGGRTRGHLVASLDKDQYSTAQPIRAEVCIRDVYENEYFGTYISEGHSEPTPFIPGGEVVFPKHIKGKD